MSIGLLDVNVPIREHVQVLSLMSGIFPIILAITCISSSLFVDFGTPRNMICLDLNSIFPASNRTVETILESVEVLDKILSDIYSALSIFSV